MYLLPFNRTGYMHNKFAIVDSATLINGSFNWSKGYVFFSFTSKILLYKTNYKLYQNSARFKNRENVLITNIPICIKEFQGQFDSLWAEF